MSQILVRFVVGGAIVSLFALLGYAALEARSMIAGEVAFVVYAVGCVYFLAIRRARSAPTAIGMLAIWGVAVAVLYAGVLR
jgi:hypothetical protein